MPEAGAINRNHAMVPSQQVEQPADLEVVQQTLVAMKQHNSRPGTLLKIVEPDSVNLHKGSFRQIAAFGRAGKGAIDQSNDTKADRHREGDSGGSSERRSTVSEEVHSAHTR
jgi:hypothetical protein